MEKMTDSRIISPGAHIDYITVATLGNSKLSLAIFTMKY